MKNRWILFGLVLSLAFNFTFLGALGYRIWQKKNRHHPEPGPERVFRPGGPPFPGGGIPFREDQKGHLEKMWKEFLPQLRQIRTQLMQERKNLGDLLMTDKPDTALIVKRLNRIGELQTRIEKAVVFQMLDEAKSMDPQQRENYIKMIIKRMGERRPGDRENPRMRPMNSDEMKNRKEQQP